MFHIKTVHKIPANAALRAWIQLNRATTHNRDSLAPVSEFPSPHAAREHRETHLLLKNYQRACLGAFISEITSSFTVIANTKFFRMLMKEKRRRVDFFFFFCSAAECWGQGLTRQSHKGHASVMCVLEKTAKPTGAFGLWWNLALCSCYAEGKALLHRYFSCYYNRKPTWCVESKHTNPKTLRLSRFHCETRNKHRSGLYHGPQHGDSDQLATYLFC